MNTCHAKHRLLSTALSLALAAGLSSHVGATACNAAWNSATAYTGGQTVSYANVNYLANWWTQGNNPSTNNGGSGSGEPWTSQGACSSGATPTPTPSKTPTPTPAPTPTPTPTPSGFVHPGVILSLQQLNYIKTQVNNGVQPFAAAFTAAKNATQGSLTFVPVGPPSGGIVECGPTSNPNYGCSNEDSDASAAYIQSVLWYITGNQTYANNAIKIMNLYAKNLKGHTNSNAPLQAAWTAEKWPAAAEIIRYTNAGWATADINNFKTMLTNQYLPFLDGTAGNGGNGNWELSMIDGMMGIAVFNEDKTLLTSTIAEWRKYMAAYWYNYADDGAGPVTFDGSPSGWNGQTVFDAATSGVSQETCRDLYHTQLGMAATYDAAETAYIQGQDLYSSIKGRMTTSLEYHARMLIGNRNTDSSVKVNVPSGFAGLCNGQYSPVLEDNFEVAYNAYHNRLGVSLPYTLQHLTQDVRPAAAPTDLHNMLWQTLTFGGS